MKGKGTHYDRRVQYLVTLSVSLASLNMGVISAWPTPSIHNLKSNGTNIDINDDEIAWMLSTMPVGFITGSLAARFVSDRLGRRAAVLGSACPIALGTWPCGDTQTSPARAPAPDPRHVTAPRGGRARPIPRTSDPELWPALSKLCISRASTVWEMLATRPAETPVGTGRPSSTAATELLQLRARRV